MRRISIVLLAVACLALAGVAPAAPEPIRLVFLDNGGEIAREVKVGIEAARGYYTGIDRMRRRPVEVVVLDATQDATVLEAAINKAKPVAVIASPRAAELAAITRLARRGRVPFLLTTPWEPSLSLDPRDPVFYVGGNAVDQAIEAAGYARIPYAAACVAAIHDESAPSRALADAFLRNRFEGTKDGGAHAVPGTVEDVSGLLMRLGSKGVNAVFVALDHEAALLVAKAASDLDNRKRWAAKRDREREREQRQKDRYRDPDPRETTPDRPNLLFADGILTAALAKETPLRARFMVGSNPWLASGPPDFYRSSREMRREVPSPAGERGYAAVSLALDALAETRVRVRQLIPALRELGYEKLGGTRVFAEWGQSRLFTWYLWKPSGDTTIRVKPTYLPDKSGGLLLRHRPSSRLRHEPDTRLVHLWWGKPKERTIDDDLRRIGLSTGGYETVLDDLIKDEILVRAAARLNRLFWRNADGTAIPGVSYKITFVAEIPERYDDHHWGAKIAGDHPSAGGMAGDPYSSIFSTFLVRTMYEQHALKPTIRREDLDYFLGKYEWATALEQNIRHDEIRSLLEGFAGAIAMTTAHELGHVAGCGHDRMSPRSIMNVVDGGGLDPDWAEWIPLHVKALETRLKRHEQPRGSRR